MNTITTKRWEEMTRPVGDVLSADGAQYAEIQTDPTLWDRRASLLRAEIEKEFGSKLDRSKHLLFEGAAGEVYMGRILHVTENFVMQEAFCNSVFVHLRKDLDRLGNIEVGQYLRVRYTAYAVELI